MGGDADTNGKDAWRKVERNQMLALVAPDSSTPQWGGKQVKAVQAWQNSPPGTVDAGRVRASTLVQRTWLTAALPALPGSPCL